MKSHYFLKRHKVSNLVSNLTCHSLQQSLIMLKTIKRNNFAIQACLVGMALVDSVQMNDLHYYKTIKGYYISLVIALDLKVDKKCIP